MPTYCRCIGASLFVLFVRSPSVIDARTFTGSGGPAPSSHHVPRMRSQRSLGSNLLDLLAAKRDPRRPANPRDIGGVRDVHLPIDPPVFEHDCEPMRAGPPLR